MSLATRIHERLSQGFLNARCLLVTDSKVLVEEAEKAGAAQVTMQLPGPLECLVLKLEKGQGGPDTQWFKFLANEKCADGAFLVPAGLDAYEAHVIECKAKVGSDSWERAKQQMAGTVARLRALAAVLQVQITQVYCYTAYREDRLTGELKADFAELRPLVGESVHTAALLDWQRDKADLGSSSEFPHRRIQLTIDPDSVGRATVAVNSNQALPG